MKFAALVLFLALFVVSGCSGSLSGATGPDGPVAEIPIKRVILYQNGIGYFERRGKIRGDVLTLQIRPSQINDILKSLTVIDRSNGRAVSVSLPLEKTGAQTLSELPEQVRHAGGLLDVLRVFRGARVEVSGKKGSVSGRVVGVEPIEAGGIVKRPGPGSPREDRPKPLDHRLTLKVGNHLVVYPVSAIEKIELTDKTLSIGLEQSLDVSLNEGNWKPITLSVRLVGARGHDIVASYIVEMPLWKPAYRVVLEEGKKPLLQGWAVVDNISGEDWNDVSLSLVAGTPISFIYDLHSPQLMRRVDLSPRGRQLAARPVIESAGEIDDDADEGDEEEAEPEEEKAERRYAKKRSAGGPGLGSRARPKPSAPRRESPPADRPTSGADELEQDAPESVEGQSVGALFRYDLKDPVTVPDRSSTLVAIVNERVKGQEIVLFRPELTGGFGASHPYRAVMLTNDTKFALEKGPVAVYSQGTFVGEAFLARAGTGTTSFLTFSIDGAVRMEQSDGSRDEGMRLLKIVDGQLVSEVLRIESTKYDIRNRHPRTTLAYVKTSKRGSEWTLGDRPPTAVETGDALFIPVSVPAKGKAQLEIKWTKRITRRVAIDTSVSTTLLRVFMKSGNAPPAVAKVLGEILEIKGKVVDLDTERRRLEKLHREHSRDQERVRNNLLLLTKTPGNAGLRGELTRKLAALEKQLGTVSGKLVQISEQKAELEKKMKVLIRGVTLTVPSTKE